MFWAEGIRNLLVLGDGATLSNHNSRSVPFQLGGRGQVNDNRHSARLSTVVAGSSCITLLNPSQSQLFSVANYALITGFDLQGYGYPTNPHYFEYVVISSIDSAIGRVCFTSPLKNTYKSTWPVYNIGNVYAVDEGGPATLYALNPTWNAEIEYRGLTIDQLQFQTYANARSITYRNVTFSGKACAIPTQNLVWQAINVSMADCTMEVDKLIGTIRMTGVTIREIDFQSSSTDLFEMSGSTVTHVIQGTPKKAIITNSTIESLNPGAYAYGRSDETICTNCVITHIAPMGLLNAGLGLGRGVNHDYTMNGGIITVPKAQGPCSWAVPGTNFMWNGSRESELLGRVIDVTQDSTNTYIKTSLAGGFPSVPQYQGEKLYIRVHPAPKFTCSNCTGSPDAVDLSQAPPGAPIYSYSKRTYDQSWPVTSTGSPHLWGKVVSLKYTVTHPYTGPGKLWFLPMYQFGYVTIDPNGTQFKYTPKIDLTTAGMRRVTPFAVECNGSAGPCGADADLSLPGPVWLSGQANPNISAAVGWAGTITVEMAADQGVVNP
jgi:hypothetical protein